MEIKFEEQNINCLSSVMHRNLSQEQTQQIRLGEDMPDIGTVLGAWGKALIRTKQWRDNAMQVTGGIMVWVLYLSEGENTPYCVEDWIPWQMKWDIPQTQQDGYMVILPTVKSVDARALSARKLMVRANILCDGNGLQEKTYCVYSPDQIPADVNLLTAEYPLMIPKEAGERVVEIQEDISKPLGKILRYDLSFCVTEQRIMASRMIFRGKGKLYILHLQDGKVQSFTQELDFAQYADLDGEYTPAASGIVMPILTSLELTQGEDKWILKAQMAAQYVVFDRKMVMLAEDAYSNLREISPQEGGLQIPHILDQRNQQENIMIPFDVQALEVADVSSNLWMSCANGTSLVQGLCQLLYYDHEGMLRCVSSSIEEERNLHADSDVDLSVILEGIEIMTHPAGGKVQVTVASNCMFCAASKETLSMVKGLKVSETYVQKESRPSLIVERFSGDRLWDVAKACGSTVSAIRQANGIETEPEQGRMLLIPIG